MQMKRGITPPKDYKNILPKLQAQPVQPIHGDLNDHNILVDGCLKEQPNISGILDFGDMCLCPRVCNVAIAGAYIVLNHDQPEAALTTLIHGYHMNSPFSSDELEGFVSIKSNQNINLNKHIYILRPPF